MGRRTERAVNFVARTPPDSWPLMKIARLLVGFAIDAPPFTMSSSTQAAGTAVTTGATGGALAITLPTSMVASSPPGLSLIRGRRGDRAGGVDDGRTSLLFAISAGRVTDMQVVSDRTGSTRYRTSSRAWLGMILAASLLPPASWAAHLAHLRTLSMCRCPWGSAASERPFR
jgi:hypothetical protein